MDAGFPDGKQGGRGGGGNGGGAIEAARKSGREERKERKKGQRVCSGRPEGRDFGQVKLGREERGAEGSRLPEVCRWVGDVC